MMPTRIQRQRTKGWRMGSAIYVGRPTKWGNPFIVGRSYAIAEDDMSPVDGGETAEISCADDAVEAYRGWIGSWFCDDLDPAELRGRDLCCWCPLDQPCHADVLLELANAPDPQAGAREEG
jgi:hypothetical protein